MDPRLVPYSERSVYQHDSEVKQKRVVVEQLVTLRNSIENVVLGGMSSFLSYRETMFSQDVDDQARRKAANEFTEFVMACIVRLYLFEKLPDDQERKPPNDVLRDLSFLELDPNTMKPCKKVGYMVANPPQVFFPKMQEDLHDKSQYHWGDLLLMWLHGKRPLPSCHVTSCRRRAICHEVLLCDEHRCHMPLNCDERCAEPCPGGNSSFCTSHRCSAEKCVGARVSPDQAFCQNHACRRCLELGLSARRAIGRPPINVCRDHSICTFPRCTEYCAEREMCCKSHLIPRCHATNKKKKPCGGIPTSRYLPYCPDHKHLPPPRWFQAADNSDDSDNSDNEEQMSFNNILESPVGQKLCTAFTSEGKPCGATSLPGSTFCYDHEAPKFESVFPAESTLIQQTTPIDAAVDTDQSPSQLLPVPNPKAVPWPNSPEKAEEADIDIQEDEDLDIDGENLQHLREVFEDPDDSSSDEEEFLDAIETTDSGSLVNDTDEMSTLFDIKPSEWTWSMDAEQRWKACLHLVDCVRRQMLKASSTVKHAHVAARKELLQAKVRAKTRVYENKSIIGGTMVGCISRLESIRATRPFAIVVEEASEVLEPLLFSCLTESTVKLEMIGDHRQLQPSVMSRFDYEVLCNANVSMFQRLIEAPPNHEIPSTVLSVQRRMRHNIANLTREFYSDVVDIRDHDACSVQLIGQKAASKRNSNVTATATKGREIPGIGPHIFMWTHNGDQKRSQVGVSRINQTEAEMTCSLAAYFVQCGVPQCSIAILTPYKGQLMLIRKLLQKDTRFTPAGLLPRDMSDSNRCRVSTIDRFQGDEEDIIIVSLVVDENSRTGFVKLANRMIVLLSRARLGCYLLANKGFLGNNSIPEHWSQTLRLLEQAGSNDAVENMLKDEDIYSGPRIGAEIPLCCPVHRKNRKRAGTPTDVQLGFCTEICGSVLTPCGHTCPLTCHWPKSSHVSKCNRALESLCKRHRQNINCHAAYSNAHGAPPHTSSMDIMKYYRCAIKVKLRLPCEHEHLLPCWEETMIVSGNKTWPSCKEPSPVPYTFVGCGHSLPVTCAELSRYSEDPSCISCQETVTFEPSCGHNTDMKCFQRKAFLDGERVHECRLKVPVILPRCGHEMQSIACGLACKIAGWSGECCLEVGTVVEGRAYGPQDFQCRKKATIVRPCGHNMELSCSEAFARSNSLPPCQRKVDIQHPVCGHSCQIACTDVVALANATAPNPIDEWEEGQAIKTTQSYPVPSCRQKIRLLRKCGHSENIDCFKKSLPLHPCSTSIQQKSLICGHLMNVACTIGKVFNQKVWPDEITAEILENHRIDESNLKKHLKLPSTAVSSVLKQMKHCIGSVDVTLSCGHTKRVACSVLGDFASGFFKDMESCSEPTILVLNCGHQTSTTCHIASRYRAGDSGGIVCESMKRQKCWNHKSCGRSLTVPCTCDDLVACNQSTSWKCSTGRHSFDLPVCSQGTPSWCPGCWFDNVQAMIDNASCFQPPLELRAIDSIPQPNVEAIHEDPNIVSKREKDLLRKQLLVKPFEQRAVQVRRIPCFRHVQGDHLDAKSFDPKRFVSKKSTYGIITKTFTKMNLTEVADRLTGEGVLLVGYATVVMVNDVTAMKVVQKGQRSARLAAFQSQDYDAMLYLERNTESLIVWDPFPLTALYRLRLDKPMVLALAEQVPKWDMPNFIPTKISFTPPPNNVVVSSTVAEGLVDNSDLESEASDIDELRSEFNAVFSGTELNGILFDLDWLGGFTFSDEIPAVNEEDILRKMQFVDHNAKPFAALNRLRKLVEKYPNCELLHLLIAAECIARSKDTANSHFMEYVQAIKAKQVLAHPWALIVFARLNDVHRAKALKIYAKTYQNQVDLLKEDELGLINSGGPKGDSDRLGWHEVLCDDWKKLQAENPSKTHSPSTDTLLSLTGLRKVKEQVFRLWNSALQLSRMKDPEIRKKNSFVCNYVFVGNPGTGKTTVARLFARILKDCGLRPKDTIIETTAQAVKDRGADEFRKSVSTALGGCLFIDEAYDLNPVGDPSGKPIVNELLTMAEDKRDEISFILAGYEEDFENKFFAYNDGLKSRFKTMIFEDFDEPELAAIWKRSREDKEWREEKDVSQVVVKRMAKMAGRKGFGNAREVRRRLEEATQSAMSRLGAEFDESNMVLTIEDVIGQDPRLLNEKLNHVILEIDEKTGWRRVKEKTKELLDLCGINYRRELLGQPQLDIFLNRLFLGNPGTGKTTCAKLYGRLLKELGFLSNGDVVSKTASDFIGQYVGESQKKTSSILENAKGKVLIIDECYALDDDLFGKQVLDTIVEKVHGSLAEDIAVLLLGYEEQMLKMITKQNPGLARRFPKDHAFYFDDYNDNELLDIIDLWLKKNEVSATIEFREKALEVLQAQRAQTNFGNAGAAELVVKGAILKAAKRDADVKTIILDVEDIEDLGVTRSDKDEHPLSILDSLYKMEKVKIKLDKMRRTWAVAKQDGDDRPNLGHFVFTGKTTVARTIANVLYSLGLIPSNKIKETSALDLTAGYVGQTKDKVNDALKEAKGGVLFIDEAYNLGLGHFGKEACDTIVAAMTSETFRDVVIVIAGYPDEINEMLKSNSGLKSRFNHFFEFPDWDSKDCVAFFQMLADRDKFEVEDVAFDDFEAGCEELRHLDGWGNGRDVTKLWEMSKSNRGERAFDTSETRKIISMEDISTAMKEMLATRRPRKASKADGPDNRSDDPQMETDFGNSRPPPLNQRTNQSNANQSKQEENIEEDHSISEIESEDDNVTVGPAYDDIARDDGVPDDIWDELVNAMRLQKEEQEALARQEEIHRQFLAEQKRRDEEARRRHEERMEQIRRDAEKKEQQRLVQEAIIAENQRQLREEMERRRREAELQRLQEKERKRLETIRRLQIIGRCPMGFDWYKAGPGWRCKGGSHSVSNEELRNRFGADA